MNGRKTQPICAPDQPEHDDPEPEDRLDLVGDGDDSAPAPAARPAPPRTTCPARPTGLAGRGCDPATFRRCKVWSRNLSPKKPATAKTATFKSSMNG